MPPKGRPPKKKRNISGLKNQSASSEIPTSQNGNNTDGDKVDDQPPKDLKDMAGSEQEDEPYSDFEPDHEWESITSRELGKRLAAQSCAIDKDSTDTDWIPFKLRKKKGYKGT
jgi:hypothetical protein